MSAIPIAAPKGSRSGSPDNPVNPWLVDTHMNDRPLQAFEFQTRSIAKVRHCGQAHRLPQELGEFGKVGAALRSIISSITVRDDRVEVIIDPAGLGDDQLPCLILASVPDQLRPSKVAAAMAGFAETGHSPGMNLPDCKAPKIGRTADDRGTWEPPFELSRQTYGSLPWKYSAVPLARADGCSWQAPTFLRRLRCRCTS